MNFSQSAYSVDENSQNLPITLIFSNPSSTEITIGVNSSPQTVTSKQLRTSYKLTFYMLHLFCIGDFDYDPGPYSASFPPLTTTASFDIKIFDNNTFEASERFDLIINPPNFVFRGTPSQVTATILDHRGLCVIYSHAFHYCHWWGASQRTLQKSCH